MDEIKAKVKQALRQDHSTDTTCTSTTATRAPLNTHTTNKLDLTVSIGHQYTGVAGTHGTSGDYLNSTYSNESRLGNRIGPYVYYDKLGGYGNIPSAGGHHTTLPHYSDNAGGYGNTAGSGGCSDPTGPHSAHLANKLDPRVYSNHAEGYRNTIEAGYSDPASPHNSYLANQADPHVGGYRNTTSTGGYNTNHTTLTDNYPTYQVDPAGPHDSHLADNATRGNANNLHCSGMTGGSTPSGPASHTTGPHKSDMMNEADPRVDSNLDGSKTYGGNHTMD
ncbi:hypothetical protein CC78DRAFT_589070 [Lojkania enalia]|uniref:Uncharacterized protein n=1 Tax=Lojkania enalia TaxID=147567 RepID=A0A9P4TS09_9PLEO|nr:hypothetical protein CC78DRAFT_589070 [Didymosphaeria enalia]